MTILVEAGKDRHLPLDRGQVWQPFQDQPLSVDDLFAAIESVFASSVS